MTKSTRAVYCGFLLDSDGLRTDFSERIRVACHGQCGFKAEKNLRENFFFRTTILQWCFLVKFGKRWHSSQRCVRMDEHEFLTIREVAALLKIGNKTAYSLAQSGELPGFKAGGQWRFRRVDIERWTCRLVRQRSKTGLKEKPKMPK